MNEQQFVVGGVTFLASVHPKEVTFSFPEHEMKYKDFDAWYDEVESFATRSERLASDVDELKAAFESARMKAT